MVLIEEYAAVTIFILILLIFPFVILTFSKLLAPKKAEKEKYKTYECGLLPFGDARKPYDVQYYFFALLFVVFDVEVAVLFPWAEVFRSFPNTMLLMAEGIVFILILAAGLLYAWKEKALEWR